MEAKRLSYKEADLFQYYLEELPQVTKAVVYERTADAVICYQGERSTLLKKVAAYRCKDVKVPDGILEHSGRELNSQYQEKLVNKVLFHYGRKVFLPAPIAAAYTGFCSIKYIWKGIQTLAKGKIEVPVLDGTAIGVSVLRGDTAPMPVPWHPFPMKETALPEHWKMFRKKRSSAVFRSTRDYGRPMLPVK